jgi:protein SSD1
VSAAVLTSAAQEAFGLRSKRLGYEMDVTSAGAVQKAFTELDSDAPQAKLALQMLITKTMKSAKYFCSGMLDISKYHHYCLNVPLYTHFTSPIRRYADIMVHRQLEAIVLGGAFQAGF